MTQALPSTFDAKAAAHEGLLERARAGDVAAFCAWMRPEETRLYRQALALCGQPREAEELVQDTLIAAWKGIGRFDGRCASFTWLYGVMIRVQSKRIRSRTRRRWNLLGLRVHDAGEEAVGMEGAIERATGLDALTAQERGRALQRMIDRLSPKQSEVIRLRYYADCSLREIAQLLKIPEGTVKSRLSLGLERLRAMGVEDLQ